MTNDRELLELAAKAAGLIIHDKRQVERDALIGPEKAGLCIVSVSTWWNPLTDDGDALRLAVKLQMCIGIVPSNIKDGYATVALAPANPVEIGVTHNGDICEAHNNDPYAATRRAIVMAAAEIGRSMK